MILKIGNILDCPEGAIIQQVNCVNKMGSGLAKAIYTKWPVVKQEFHTQFIRSNCDGLLGHVHVIDVGEKIIINAYSQFNCGRDGKRYTNYDAVRSCFTFALNEMDSRDIEEIAVPYLYGCGLGGGDWDVVYEIIDEILKDRAIFYKLK